MGHVNTRHTLMTFDMNYAYARLKKYEIFCVWSLNKELRGYYTTPRLVSGVPHWEKCGNSYVSPFTGHASLQNSF